MLAVLKGWLGEAMARFALWISLDGKAYRRFHNLMIPCGDGTTQVDHVIVSVYGVFVVETKNMRGWIFGDERQRQWTQSIYGKKFRFQNPLHQNYRHVQALREVLGLPEEAVHSMVCFIGECRFKTPMPPNVLRGGWAHYIRKFQQPVMTTQEKDEIVRRLCQLKKEPVTTRALHVEGLRRRYGSDQCPKCGEALVLRNARKGPRAGLAFYGCSAYPKCRYVRNA